MDEPTIQAKSYLRIDVRYSGGRGVFFSSEFSTRCSIFGASRSFLSYYMKEDIFSKTSKINVHAHICICIAIKQIYSMIENEERLLTLMIV